jgi:hypothetical protein
MPPLTGDGRGANPAPEGRASSQSRQAGAAITGAHDLATWHERTKNWLRKTGAASFAGAKEVTRRSGPRNPATQGAHGFPTDPTCVLMPFSIPFPLWERAGGKRAPRD